MKGRSRQRSIVNTGRQIVLSIGILGIAAGLIAAFALYKKREMAEPAESSPDSSSMTIELEVSEHVASEQSDRTKEELAIIGQYQEFLRRMDAVRMAFR